MRAALLVAQASCLSASLFAAGIDALPVNQWVKLDTRKEPGYAWSAIVYVPSRGQVLHWGAAPSRAPEHDDARAFEPATCEWVSDYPSAPSELLRSQDLFAQLVWVARYGVLVSFAGTTSLLRPDFSQARWE